MVGIRKIGVVELVVIVVVVVGRVQGLMAVDIVVTAVVQLQWEMIVLMLGGAVAEICNGAWKGKAM